MAKAIMIQGTMSNVGKSLLVAGLCRIFRQDGCRVAPFKSQNMALNSFITEEGLEMGRAQVMQAEAAGISPDVRMNPILLKPTTDTGSQVILRGEVLGNMGARDYFKYKKQLMPMVLEAYRQLAAEYDIIVIEGAGSPAEINLKKDDIVNMGLAKAVGAPVFLVGDIDRGGVFAQLLGTQMLLESDEQALLKGFIINKFRGDKTILDPGIEMLRERGGIPVAGVVPFMQLDIDEEDSLAPQLTWTNRPPAGKRVEIAVARLPHLSNFTDFNVFSRMTEVDLRYISKPWALGNADMVILPGTKNTMADLRWLKESGMAAAIDALRSKGRVIFGVCGGYQMLGQQIMDPDAMEEGGCAEGLGFLDTETVFSNEKRRTRIKGRLNSLPGVLAPLGGMEIEGYEIHMGRTGAREASAVVGRSAGNSGQGVPGGVHITKNLTGQGTLGGFCDVKDLPCQETPGGFYDVKDLTGQETLGGFCDIKDLPCQGGAGYLCAIKDLRSGSESLDGAACGNIYGTYVHGIFDAPGIARRVVESLAGQKGLTLPTLSEGRGADAGGRAYKETQYDLLADTLREHLDMRYIYKILAGEQ